MIVGSAEDLLTEEFEIERVSWAGDHAPNESSEGTIKIRYAHPGTPSTVTPLPNDRARVQLHEPQKAVTPGQAAVFYDGDIVAGGGWICRQTAAVPA